MKFNNNKKKLIFTNLTIGLFSILFRLKQIKQIVLDNVKNGKIDVKNIDNSYEKIINIKNKLD